MRFLLPVQFTCIRQVVEILMTCLVSGRLCKFLGHLIPSYELLPWLGVRRRLSCVVRRTQSVNIFSRLRQILSRATKTNGERDERANFNQIESGHNKTWNVFNRNFSGLSGRARKHPSSIRKPREVAIEHFPGLIVRENRWVNDNDKDKAQIIH